jgi:hypothetical protein
MMGSAASPAVAIILPALASRATTATTRASTLGEGQAIMDQDLGSRSRASGSCPAGNSA